MPFDTGGGLGDERRIDWAARTCPLHLDPGYRAAKDQVLLRKNYHAVGSFDRDHRSQALDQLGFASQMVLKTFASAALQMAEQGENLDLAYAMGDAHNQAMFHFCEVDARLLPVAYIALADPNRAAEQARTAIEGGAVALLIASACPRHHSPSHIGLDRVWAQAQDARGPIVMHVGGGGRLLSPMYFENGLPPVPDFHGGAENFRSVLQNLSLRPSEFVRCLVRVTPYPHEDTGWIISNTGPEICLFSPDYPHVEGGRNPLKRFHESLAGCTDAEIENFYCHNMEDLMGPHIPRPAQV